MKILYAIQATGNGHVSRALEIIPHLMKYGEVDLLLSGRQADIQLPYLIKYKKKGLAYTFGKHGGIDIIDSIKHLRPLSLLKDIYAFPVHDYDLVINDFEPVTAWACVVKHKPCIALSHQASFLSELTPRILKADRFAETIFKHYAPASFAYGFHFKSFDNFIYTPVIRSGIRKLDISNKGHITVYLPAHQDEVLLPHLQAFPDVKWEVFSKHTKQTSRNKNVDIFPVNSEGFTSSLAASNGLLTAGGFESVAEAIYLRKKVMVIPMIHQYEQQCNALAAEHIGVTRVLKIDSTFGAHLGKWLHAALPVNIHYPDFTADLIEFIIHRHASHPLEPAF